MDMTVSEALAQAAARLQGVADRPWMEAERLLAHVLKCDRAWLLAHGEERLKPRAAASFGALVERRAAHEPLPYLLGEVEFFGLTFKVTPAVLIPRPETEGLVELVIAWLNAHPHARTVADVGTGSGCIAVSLAHAVPRITVAALDNSPDALTVARQNVRRLGVTKRVFLLHGHLLEPLPMPVDVIVSNPPYVAAHEWEALPPSVRREPRQALLGGADGLALITELLRAAEHYLSPGGFLAMEIGETQGAAVLRLAWQVFPQARCEVRRDAFGRERFLCVERRG